MRNPTQDTPSLRTVVGRRLAAVAAAFLILVSLLMAANVYLLRTADPLDTPALKTLTGRMEQDPGNEALREQVRELDWMARRAFFVHQWQIRTGYLLLAVGVLVFLVALQLAFSGERPSPRPVKCPGTERPWNDAARSRRVLVASLALLFAVAWGAVLHLGRRARVPDPDTGEPAAKTAAAELSAEAVETEDAAPQALRRTPEAAWPSFRGVHGLGVAHGADPPTFWNGSTGEGVLWKVAVPRGGFSSPVVWDDRVFLTGADENVREVYCYDTRDGTRLWTADTAGVTDAPGTLPKVTDDTGYAASSVATDGGRVAAIFGTGVILGLDTDGRRLWARSLGTPGNPYGHSSSLLLLHDTLYVQFDHSGDSVVLALDAETGRDRWRRPRSVGASWASPILVEGADRHLLVLAAAPTVSAYDARTGEERWSQEVLNGEIGSSPAYAAGRVFFANQYARAVALDAADGALLWSITDLELPDAGSPVATGDHLFLPTSYGDFTCVSAADGSVLWEHAFDTGGYGSPVLSGDRVYWVTQDGTTRIFRADGTFELIAEPPLGEASSCTPALVGRRLYIRGEKHLFCIGAE